MPYDAHPATQVFSPLRSRIAGYLNGPPTSANGGITAGLLGKHVGREVEVTLKRPIPLEADLHVIGTDEGARLMHGDLELASARPATLAIDVPHPVSMDDAVRASAAFPGHDVHPFPTCFVCGTARHGDGMCLFTGRHEEGVVAAPWTPRPLRGESAVTPELVGAALDCPSGWALLDQYGADSPLVTGRLTYRIDRSIRCGEPHVAMGWTLGQEGRKFFAGSAVFDARGNLCAVAKAIWFRLA